MYRALDIACYIITYCVEHGHPISNLQLQKILYYIQLYYLKETGFPAFRDSIEAWQFGPVVPNVYYRFSGNGAMPITSTFNTEHINAIDKNNFDPIIDEKSVLPPWDLVAETHHEGGAWERNYRGPDIKNIIPLGDIEAYG